MATIAQKIIALDQQRAALGAKCAQCGITDVDGDSSLYDIMRALYKKATGYTMQFQAGPYDYSVEIPCLREIMAYSVNTIFGSELDDKTATLTQITDAIVELEQPSVAYAVCVPDSGGTKYELRFFRSTTEPVVGGTYRNKTIAYVYKNFEDVAALTNSKVPWYNQHYDITSVHFDDAIHPVSCAYWFYWQTACTSYDLALLDTSNATSFAYMFYYCSAVQTLNLSSLDTRKATNFTYMFYNCSALASLDARGWNMRKAQNMSCMFRNCTSLLSLNLSTWKFGTALTNLNQCFNNCSKLVTIYVAPGTDISYATSATQMFTNCTKLKGGNNTAFSTSNVTGAYARDDISGAPGYFTGYMDVTETAYAVYLDSGEFVMARAASVPTVGDLYKGKEIMYVYTGFENIASAMNGNGWPWQNERNNPTSISLDCWIKPKTCSYIFAYFTSCTSYDIELMDMTLARDFSNMFTSGAMTELDITPLCKVTPTNVGWMFNYCGNLVTIYAAPGTDWSTVSPTYVSFLWCNSLVGGNGTQWNSTNNKGAYCVIDGLDNKPGYFTAKS